MIEPDLIARAIASLEDSGKTEALMVLRLLERTYPVPGLTVEAYATELEVLTHAEACFVAACAKAQCSICYERLRHVRAEYAQAKLYANEPSTIPAPPEPPEEESDVG